MAIWYRRDKDKLVLSLYVQPGATRNHVVGLHGDALKIKLTAPPIDDRANAALRHFIATVFNVPLRQVVLTRGKKSRHKIIEVNGCTMDPQRLLDQS